MVMSRTIQIRLKKEQYEQIRLASQQRGFPSLSSYLRHMALHADFTLHQKVSEIHAFLMPRESLQKFKRNPFA